MELYDSKASIYTFATFLVISWTQWVSSLNECLAVQEAEAALKQCPQGLLCSLEIERYLAEVIKFFRIRKR